MAERRRVALVASSYHPHTGGVEEHVRHVARELTARGNQVVVWTVDRGEHLGVRVVDGVEVHYLPTPLPARSVGAAARFLVELPAAATSWGQAFRRFRPHVVHVQCFGPNGVYAARLARLTRTPLIVSSHGETFMDDHAAFEHSALLRGALDRALHGACRVTGCSQVVLDDLATRFGFQDGTVVPNGVDLGGAAVSRRPAAVPTVFAVGRVERMKGFDLLVDAFARSDLPEDARLVIGGDGEMLGALRDQGRALGLGGRLVLPGMLTSRQVAEQMVTATVVVVPSRREAFGIVVLEAWRSGTPVVVTSRGGPARLVTDGVTGLVVDPEDRDALAACLSRLVNDPATADRLGIAGRVAVKAFPWSRVAAEYEQIYDGCVRR